MRTLSIGEVLRRTARRYPNREALVFEGTRLTFRELDERVDRLANALLARGIAPGNVVSVISRNCHEYLEIYFACARIGAIMNAINPRLTERETRVVLEHAGTRMLLVEAELQGTVEAIAAGGAVPLVVHQGAPSLPGAVTYDSLLAEGAGSPPDVEVDSKSPVLLLYTFKGGGQPKGALLSHENFVWDSMTYQTHVGFTRQDRILQGMPFHHVAGLHMFTNAALIMGLTLVIARQWRPDLICELIESERCTAAVIVSTALRQLMDGGAAQRYDLSSLHTVLATAGQYDRTLITRAMYELGLDRVLFAYGLTEASPLVAITETTGETLWKENCLGWPVWYNEIRVVLASGDLAETGEVGELWVRGPNVFLGYFQMPVATRAAITDEGWLRTGDLVTVDADGCIFFAGRLGTLVKTGGEMVDVTEVEQAIITAAPELDRVGVAGRPDPKWGEAVVAYCTLRPGAQLTAAELSLRLRDSLASFKIPKEIQFLERLPCNEAGEIDRVQLVRLATGV